MTLNHYTHPRWFWERGGWEDPGCIESFRRFTEAAADALGPRVKLWVTLNEPVVLLLGGYLGGEIPPGKRGFRAAARAFEHMLRAHVEAAAAIRERVPDARIGIAHNMLEFAPDRAGNILDRRLARVADRLYNTALLEAIATGDLAWSFPGEGRMRARIPELPAANDYVGVNYYSRVHIRFRGRPGAVGEYCVSRPERPGAHGHRAGRSTPTDSTSFCGRRRSAGKPVLVTENGIATSDDRRRCDFLREHLAVLAHRRAAGTPITGYFYWSLLDNFEWLEGFRPRFGLFEVDYTTFARRRRPSADVFAAMGRWFTAGGSGRRTFRRFSNVTSSETPASRARASVRS